MKILCSQFSNALYHIFKGWQNVLENCGHKWVWVAKNKPIFQAFDENKDVDIYIGETYNITTAHIKCFAQYPNVKIVLKGNNWGDLEVDTTKYPIGIANKLEKQTIEKLKAHTGKPDLIFNFYHKNWMEPTMGNWKFVGCETIDLQPAADTFTYYKTEPIDSLKSDLAFVGGYWAYKSEHLNWLIRLCNPVGKYNIKILGNQAWPVVNYLGVANDDICNKLLNSATICPNLSEPHVCYGFEVNERIFKLAYAKCFCISDSIRSLEEDTFPNKEMVTASNPDEFKEKVDYYLSNPDERLSHIEQCHTIVKEKDTYFDRVVHLFNKLGFEQQSLEILAAKERFLNDKQV